jgi:hypothetical protein
LPCRKSYADTDSNSYAYGNRHAYRDGYTYCYCGAEVYADAPAARHASSTPIGSSLVG